MYAERVMQEQGFHGDDPLMHLVQLKWYLRSATNAIMDSAIHVDGMTREEAMKLMTETGFQEEREAAGKWVRAQLTSAQLSTYFVGYQEHADMRAEAEHRWARLRPEAYHDRVLSYGRRRCGSCASLLRRADPLSRVRRVDAQERVQQVVLELGLPVSRWCSHRNTLWRRDRLDLVAWRGDVEGAPPEQRRARHDRVARLEHRRLVVDDGRVGDVGRALAPPGGRCPPRPRCATASARNRSPNT